MILQVLGYILKKTEGPQNTETPNLFPKGITRLQETSPSPKVKFPRDSPLKTVLTRRSLLHVSRVFKRWKDQRKATLA